MGGSREKKSQKHIDNFEYVNIIRVYIEKHEFEVKKCHLHITQSTLSHHMKILCDAEIVQGRKEGKWVYYSINLEGANHAKKLLEQQLSLEDSGEGKGSCCSR